MRPNTPGEVSILIGVALTEEDFCDQVRTSDWLNRFAEPEVAANYWRDEYLPFVVKPIEELIGKARMLGAKMAQGTLPELKRASAQSKVVVVMAHWKDSHVEFDDLTSGVPREVWRQRASQHSSSIAQWLAAKFGEKGTSAIDEILGESLNIELPEDTESPHLTRICESEVSRAARRRQELDSIFQEMIRPGNRLELLDGLHPKEAVEAMVAPHFDGVIDFAACTSTILADYVAHRRRNRVSLVQAPNAIEFVATAQIVASTLELLARGPFSYQEARTHARGLWEGAVCAI
jgi:hypothetical protein